MLLIVATLAEITSAGGYLRARDCRRAVIDRFYAFSSAMSNLFGEKSEIWYSGRTFLLKEFYKHESFNDE